MPRCWDSGGVRYCQSRWHEWGRWVAFAVIVGVAVIAFFLVALINARRRRSRGLRPYTGTAWMAPPPPYHQQAHADPYNRPPPPPQYTQSPQYYQGPVNGYFGSPQPGSIELQSPPNAYYGGDRAYQPPPGPPPQANGKP